MEDIFHGNEKTGVVSQAKQLLGGYYPFDSLFNNQTNLIATGNTDPTNSITNLVL
jgi:hypothetical protein